LTPPGEFNTGFGVKPLVLLAAWIAATLVGAIRVSAAEAPPEQALTRMHPMLTNNVARPLRYFPDGTDFVITNGAEFFNRPLYCLNSAFRIDAGDKPEFSLYLPGRGGNLRFGIKTSAGVKWLNEAEQIIARYRPGSMHYGIRDPLLGYGDLSLKVLPLSDTKGLIACAELHGANSPVELILAFGGANGMKGKRGGDIGCESEPVSQFFQLRPEQCRGNTFTVISNAFILHGKTATIAGTASSGAAFSVADANQWTDLEKLTAPAAGGGIKLPVAVGQIPLRTDRPVYLALEQVGADSDKLPAHDLPELFSAAEAHRRAIAERVVVQTPDPFVNAAAQALSIAADAVWDGQQKSFMHGAVAWRVRLLGWRGPYAGDALGWHDRTAAHFAGFAREQNTSPVPPTTPPADEDSNLSRNETALHSNGDMTRSHYDMNLVAVDAFFRHLLWTGDLDYARQMWPVIERHLAWERRLFRREFGPDRLPLYEAYAAIWASDNLQYDGGGVAHASAYNYFENMMAARVARLIGKDASPYKREADLIRRAMEKYLWLPDEGNFAEFRDYLGLQLAHPSAGLWTFYNVMDSGVPTPDEARQMSRWVDTHIAHIPMNQSLSSPVATEEAPFVLPETSWMPYQWSVNNVVVAESVHTSLGYWQANRPETAFALFKGALLETMYTGLCPGNIGAMTSHDAARGEAQRDFADGIGITSRALVEGLFGVKPDTLAGQLKIVPGFPADWQFASIRHPDLNFDFRREGGTETYLVESKFSKPMRLVLQIPAFSGQVGSIVVNGQPAKYQKLEGIMGVPRIEVRSEPAANWKVVVAWKPEAPRPITAPPYPAPLRKESAQKPVEGKAFNWSEKISASVKLETIALAPFFNERVMQIFRNEYRSPRSPFCSLAIPKQGLGGWCEPDADFDVEDSGLRAAAASQGGKVVLPDGVPLATPGEPNAKNIIFVSQWDNYPREVAVPLSGKSARAYLLMAGSSNPMQSQFDNGEVIVTYTDGSTDRLPLRNPVNWWPIDQDYFIDDFAFRRPGPIPPRVNLKTGQVRLLDAETFKGKGGTVPGGAATVLDLPLNPHKELKSLTVRALANEVVIGLMSVTLER
jgi:hypothetical protein